MAAYHRHLTTPITTPITTPKTRSKTREVPSATHPLAMTAPFLQSTCGVTRLFQIRPEGRRHSDIRFWRFAPGNPLTDRSQFYTSRPSFVSRAFSRKKERSSRPWLIYFLDGRTGAGMNVVTTTMATRYRPDIALLTASRASTMRSGGAVPTLGTKA